MISELLPDELDVGLNGRVVRDFFFDSGYPRGQLAQLHVLARHQRRQQSENGGRVGQNDVTIDVKS